jgi:predicted transcriptional regulator
VKTILLISLHQDHMLNIFSGKKRVELRKIRPRVTHGDLVVLYVTRPLKALVGSFEVAKVLEGPPERLWRKVGTSSGVTRSQFDSYYDGSSYGYGIMVKNPSAFPKSLSLADIRRVWTKFFPPQGYKYLNQDERRLLIKILTNHVQWSGTRGLPELLASD